MSVVTNSRPPAEVWSCHRPSEIALRHWEDGSVVFDDANGQLQCLSPVSGMLMQLMLDGPASNAHDLAHTLLEETPNEEDVEMVENALREFSNLNFVRALAA